MHPAQSQMMLMPCVACGQAVSVGAFACPTCGQPNKKKEGMSAVVIVAILVGILMALPALFLILVRVIEGLGPHVGTAP